MYHEISVSTIFAPFYSFGELFITSTDDLNSKWSNIIEKEKKNHSKFKYECLDIDVHT